MNALMMIIIQKCSIFKSDMGHTGKLVLCECRTFTCNRVFLHSGILLYSSTRSEYFSQLWRCLTVRCCRCFHMRIPLLMCTYTFVQLIIVNVFMSLNVFAHFYIYFTYFYNADTYFHYIYILNCINMCLPLYLICSLIHCICLFFCCKLL